MGSTKITAVVPDVWSDVHDERASLLELLETLSPDEWNTQSLCTEWRIRDVVGHLVSETTMSIRKLITGTIKSGFRVNKFIASDACRKGALSDLELVEAFRTAVSTRTHLPGLSSMSMLEGIVIHSLDIRQPLLRDNGVPERRMVLVASDLLSSRFFVGQKLFAGLRIAATDADWSRGEGEEVKGPIEGFVLAMSGRFVGLDKLQGGGMAAVRQRAQNL
ncbi:MAG: maleylpyruvate isomerase family mycothiol-dependent enzyme [Acidimicrobiales bacterium]